MGSYHYTSTSQFVFAAVDSNSKPPTNPRTPYKSPSHLLRRRLRGRSPGAAVASKIQAAFRGHLVHRHVCATDAEASRLERMLRWQETVDAICGDERERARFSEALMVVLLLLDAVPGYYPVVRDARRAVSRRVVGLQEVFDAVIVAPEARDRGRCLGSVDSSLEQVLEGI
ncbi:LOW QUALITY PROTEIN: BAG family molecular chaperone regulator 5, mitochondrial-like [Phragmites australis]|uniref:LOW QUALITY PROTEIN: BAG family molecular chaperone regulator 5, mitochondrial-like n=1 Tax=Phragmites australis TaxID=29695 RepID=UPI002D7871FC|nr:LOW QUALITY PROTEIN: BAG family molecular chaperone regulator 5, mitochondrial-like [Phragmites australis]